MQRRYRDLDAVASVGQGRGAIGVGPDGVTLDRHREAEVASQCDANAIQCCTRDDVAGGTPAQPDLR